jgi:Spy/CpxP family protein refolding chaperone
MKRSALVYVLVALLALTVIGAMAQGRRGAGGPPMAPPANPPMTCQSILGLSPAQVGEIDRLRAAFVQDTERLRTELQTRQQEIMKLWAAPLLDVNLIKSKAADTDPIASQLRDKAIDLHAAILGVFTPEQRAKCAQCCRSGQCGMGCGMGMGCPMGGMGMGMGPGMGMGMGPGPRGGGMGMGPNGAGCPMGNGPAGIGPKGAGCPMAK